MLKSIFFVLNNIVIFTFDDMYTSSEKKKKSNMYAFKNPLFHLH